MSLSQAYYIRTRIYSMYTIIRQCYHHLTLSCLHNCTTIASDHCTPVTIFSTHNCRMYHATLSNISISSRTLLNAVCQLPLKRNCVLPSIALPATVTANHAEHLWLLIISQANILYSLFASYNVTIRAVNYVHQWHASQTGYSLNHGQ